MTVGLVPLLLLGVACGDDAESASPTSSAPVDAEALSDDPVRVGFVNLEGGVVSLPEIRIGAEVATAHINTDLGGIDGRPIELVTCDLDLSPERSIDCANELIGQDVAMVVLGIDTAIDSSLPIYEAAGVPVVGNTPFTEAALSSDGAFFLGTSFFAAAASPLKHAADAGNESVTYLFGDSAVNRDLVSGTLEPYAEELGIAYRTVFYDQSAPDWSVIASTAMADSPDVIGSPGTTEPECTGFVGALRSAGFEGGILAGQCSAFVDELGPAAAGALVTTYRWLPADAAAAPDESQVEIATYVAEMTEAGNEELVDGYAAGWFAILMDVAEVLGAIDGSVEPDAVLAAFRATVDQPAFMGDQITCDGSVQVGDSVCSAGLLVYEVTQSGELRLVSDGFVDVGDIPVG